MTLSAPRVVVLGCCAVFLYGLALDGIPSSWAHDHKPPLAFLRTTDGRQKGNNYHYWWTTTSGNGCVSMDAVGPFKFPNNSLESTGNEDVWITIRKRQKPKKLGLKSWMAVDDQGQPVGAGEAVEHALKKIDGKWRVRFSPPFSTDNYLRMSASWRDFEGCGGAQGGYWTFHLSISPV